MIRKRQRYHALLEKFLFQLTLKRSYSFDEKHNVKLKSHIFLTHGCFDECIKALLKYLLNYQKYSQMPSGDHEMKETQKTINCKRSRSHHWCHKPTLFQWQLWTLWDLLCIILLDGLKTQILLSLMFTKNKIFFNIPPIWRLDGTRTHRPERSQTGILSTLAKMMTEFTEVFQEEIGEGQSDGDFKMSLCNILPPFVTFFGDSFTFVIIILCLLKRPSKVTIAPPHPGPPQLHSGVRRVKRGIFLKIAAAGIF